MVNLSISDQFDHNHYYHQHHYNYHSHHHHYHHHSPHHFDAHYHHHYHHHYYYHYHNLITIVSNNNIYLSIHLSIHLSIYQSIHLSRLNYHSNSVTAISIWLLWILCLFIFAITEVKFDCIEALYFSLSSLSTGGLYAIPVDSPDWYFVFVGVFACTGIIGNDGLMMMMMKFYIILIDILHNENLEFCYISNDIIFINIIK